jgi:hypothetical protein
MGAKDFSLYRSVWYQPASYPMATEGYFPWDNAAGA